MVKEGLIAAGDLGMFGSWFEILGGVCKVCGGIFVDRYSPVAIYSASLFFIGVASACFFISNSLTVQVSLWTINGMAQAFAWPALCRIFMAWFPVPSVRGRWYSGLGTSQNAGAAITPLLLLPAMAAFGWEASLYLPGGLAFACSALLILFVADRPSKPGDVGLPPAPPAAVEDVPASAPASNTRAASKRGAAASVVAAPAHAPAPSPAPRPSAPLSAWDTLLAIISSPVLWLLGLTYFFNTLVRNGITDWVVRFATSPEVGLSETAAASLASSFELGGALGGLAAGYLSDRLWGGLRGPVMALASFALVPLPLLLPWIGSWATAASPAVSSGVVASLGATALKQAAMAGAYFLLGVISFAPHVLNGLVAREVAAPSVLSSAGGFTKALGQAGGACAGFPIGRLAASSGWHSVMAVLSLAGLGSALLALPLWSVVPWAVATGDGKASTALTSPLSWERTAAAASAQLARLGLPLRLPGAGVASVAAATGDDAVSAGCARGPEPKRE